MLRFFRVLAGAALVAALAVSAGAQHLGDVSLSTTSVNLATNTNCTGSAQNFITGTTPNFSNAGQIRHFLSVASIVGIQQMRAEIDGIDNQGNVYRISDIMEFAGLTTTRQGNLVGSGNFPRIQVSVTCSPNTGTFTASYAGDFGSSPVNAGSYLTAQIDHINWFGAPANANQADNGFQTPFGSSAGTLLVQFSPSAATGTTIGVGCNSLGVTAATTVFQATLVNTTALQTFSIPASACPTMNVQYNSAASAGTITVEMIFSPPGFVSTNVGQGVGLFGTDPCASPNSPKNSQAINIVTATTTSIVAPGTVNSIYVCGGSLTIASSGTTAATAQFEFGTGATCGTGTTLLTGTMGTGTATATNDGIPVVLPAGSTNFTAPTGNRLCIVTAGTTVNVQGYISYVQQ
jgi:hypothetical protein